MIAKPPLTLTSHDAAPQLVSIATLGSTTGVGGFFTTGFKGVINGTAGSLGAAANLPAVAPSASPVAGEGYG